MKQYKVRIGGRDYDVAVNSIGPDGIADVTVNGKALKVDTLSGAATAQKASTMSVTPSGSAAAPRQEAPSAKPAAAAAPSAAGTAVTSPLPGVIVDVCVKEGDKVQRGQAVAVLEAMKMENSIEAEKEGTVTAVHVAKGDTVQAGAPIVTIA